MYAHSKFEQLESRRLLSASVVDLNLATAGSNPTSFAELNGNVYFLASDGRGGLFKTDGTDQGTSLVTPADAGALKSISSLITFDGALYFAGRDTAHGWEIWKTDGTAEGVQRVTDLGSADSQALIRSMTVVGHTLYFDLLHSGVYRTDGTAEGTTQVLALDDEVTQIDRLAGSTYFIASSAWPASKIWRSNGTAEGTTLVASDASCPPVEYDGNAYYTNTGNQLIKIDAAGAATAVNQFAPSLDSNASVLGVVNNKLMVMTGDYWHRRLYQSDGTQDGTALIKSLDAQTAAHPVILGDRLFFTLSDGRTPALWVTDGTGSGTIHLRDLAANTSEIPQDFVAIGDTLYFSAKNTTTGARELWKTDGTLDGTMLVTTASPDTPYNSGIRLNLAAIGNRLFFSGQQLTTGWEPWVSDGTSQGSHAIKDINTNTADSNPIVLGFINGKAIIRADNGNGQRVFWASDGTQQGTVALTIVPPRSSLGDDHTAGVVYNGAFYFSAADASNHDVLWKTDGTPHGTAPVYSLSNSSSLSAAPGQFTLYQGKLLFVSTSGIYSTDGTTQGTTLLKAVSFAHDLAVVGQKLYFAVSATGWTYDPTSYWHGPQLWVSDGTTAGTQMVVDFYPQRPSTYPNLGGPTDFMDVSGHLVFRYIPNTAGASGDFGTLYTSDGTAAGTQQLSGPKFAHALIKIGSAACFSADGDIWRTDGTQSGTQRLTHLGTIPAEIIFAGKYFFFATSSQNTTTLWRSDATDAGTVQVKQFIGSGYTLKPASVNGKLLFSVSSDDFGPELWQSDGTAQGTFLVQDINPGPDGSFPVVAAADGDTLAVIATDLQHGKEVWFFDAPIGADDPSSLPPVIPIVPPKAVTPTPTYAWSKGVLTITGTDAAESFLLRRRATNSSILEILLAGKVKRTFAYSSVTSINLDAFGGNDKIDLRAIGIPSKVTGGFGADLIYGSQAADRISGGEGNDSIYGGDGKDILHGDAGADKLYGEGGSDYVYAGAGKNVIRGGAGVDRLYVALGIDDVMGNPEDIVTNLVS